ncbi:hypothetical protein [Luteolibacter luteus]|uniref:Uncharacterized protein n=1 Tax=Luteolibacter luteus TaxID=2728835 RepID=A0A858RIC1_9BACT|nr:hypothetical protein [Luteolibacter luteus]QJE95970.1 hypothetical protein HHL09_09310 [Luteolibacter luteus]
MDTFVLQSVDTPDVFQLVILEGVSVPPGGTAGQILAKASDRDFHTVWVDAPEGTGGGGGTSITVSAGFGRFTYAGTDYKFPVSDQP